MLRDTVIIIVSASAGMLLAGILASSTIEDYKWLNEDMEQTLKMVKGVVKKGIATGNINKQRMDFVLKEVNKSLKRNGEYNKEE